MQPIFDTLVLMTDDATTAGRGRPREFDPDEALDQVLRVFWEKGYEATSVADIVEATGLNKSSIYNEFGSKDALYEKALERYMQARLSLLTDLLGDGTGGLDDVTTLLGFMREEAAGDVGRMGCFAVNDAAEFGTSSARALATSRRWRTGVREAITCALTRAEDLGEIPPGSAATYAGVFVPWMLGMSVVARGGADESEVDEVFAAARDLLEQLRVS